MPPSRRSCAFTDADSWRVTLFATNTPAAGPGRQLADLEDRHRLRARCEDRIRALKDSGLRNLPHDFAKNRIWLELVLLATDLLAWTQTLARAETPARRWEPNGCGYACSPWPAGWSPPPGGCACGWPPPGPGPASSSTVSPRYAHSEPPEPHPYHPSPENAADAATRHAHKKRDLEAASGPADKPPSTRSRKFEASRSLSCLP